MASSRVKKSSFFRNPATMLFLILMTPPVSSSSHAQSFGRPQMRCIGAQLPSRNLANSTLPVSSSRNAGRNPLPWLFAETPSVFANCRFCFCSCSLFILTIVQNLFIIDTIDLKITRSLQDLNKLFDPEVLKPTAFLIPKRF